MSNLSKFIGGGGVHITPDSMACRGIACAGLADDSAVGYSSILDELADTYTDDVRRGQDKLENDPTRPQSVPPEGNS